MATPDKLYVALIAIALTIDHFVLWREFLRRSETDPARARIWIWSAWTIMLWTLVAAGIALWIVEERNWASLWLVLPEGWWLVGAIVLVLAVLALYTRSVSKVSHLTPERRTALQSRFGDLDVLLPHTRTELIWFIVLSLSAGFCEEFIFRGYLIWVLQPSLTLWGAAAFSVVLFAMAHAYQGSKGIMRTGTVGLLLTAVVLIFGSLLPAIIIHAVMDIGSGAGAWLVFREPS